MLLKEATATVEIRRTPEEWQALLAELSPFQRRIFRAAMRTAEDAGALAQRLYERAVWVYEQTLLAEAGRFGYYAAQVSLTNEEILALIEQETEESAAGIVHTYNYDLARAILRIGQEHDEEDPSLYARLLFGAGGWWARRRAWKDVQIGTWETWRRINQALGDFYERNELPISLAEVVPYDAVCPVCRMLVAGNPYTPGQVVSVARQLPAHVNCPHYVRTIPAGKVKGPLWLGG